MRFFSLKIFLLAVILVIAQAWDDIIISPPSGKTGTVSVLLFAQGAQIKTSQYSEILSLLQESVSFPLWIGIPQCLSDTCSIPTTLSSGMDRITKLMKLQGMKAEYTFYGGHSLGGAMLPDYVNSVKDTAKGMVLLGAFMTRKFKTATTSSGRPQVSFPVPSLTIGGELDGLCRISRISEALYTQVTYANSPSAAAKQMPVTVVEGMNHMEFASGVAPSFVSSNDLQAEITESQAHKLVVADMSAFLTGLATGSSSAWSTISSRVAASTKFTQPIIDALLMEGYFQFLPPCFCETKDEYGYLQYGTCVSTAACNGGSPWTGQHAQQIMGAYPGVSMTAVDSIHLVTEENPSCHLPHIHGNPVNNANPGSTKENTAPICASPSKCHLDVTTVTEPIYENGGEVDIWRAHFSLDWLDTGFLPISANEMKTKLKSREAIWQAAGVQNVSYVLTDKPSADGGSGDRCGEIIQASIDWALSKLPAKTLKRFQTYGQKFVVGPDLGTCAAGPCWIWDPLRWNKDDTKNVVNVQSVWFGAENYNGYPCGEDKAVPCSAGFHYCKLLSPARALEWMYVDGLKNKLSTKV